MTGSAIAGSGIGPQGVQGPQGAAGPTGATAAISDTALSISSGIVNVDCSQGDFFTLTMTTNVTSLTFSNLPAAGKAQTILIQITQNAGSAMTFAWPSSFKWPSGSAAAISTALGAVDVIAATTFDQGTTWLVNISNGYA